MKSLVKLTAEEISCKMKGSRLKKKTKKNNENRYFVCDFVPIHIMFVPIAAIEVSNGGCWVLECYFIDIDSASKTNVQDYWEWMK